MTTTTSRWTRCTRWFHALLVVLAFAWVAPVAHAGPPGMPDPRMMSGIPRPWDGNSPGTISVRCLNGSFAEPAIGAEVTLELTAADGETKVSRKAVAAEEGRATFDDLGDFAGGVAVAKVTLGGEALKSQPILVDPQTAMVVMLVKGAGEVAGAMAPPDGAPGAGGPHGGGPHGAGGDTPSLREGVPFALPPAEDGSNRAAGTLVVGIIEPEAGAPAPRAGVPVKLEIRRPSDAEGAEPEVRDGVTDAQGRAAFAKLSPPDLPEGTTFVVIAQIEEGEAPRRSESFEMEGPPKALIFTPSGRLDAGGAPAGPHGGQAAAPTGGPPMQRRPVPPPAPAPNLAKGIVEVLVIDGTDAPVKRHKVTLVKRDLTGRNVEFHAKTNDMGIARFDDVEVAEDAFYMVASTYDGAPYQSGFFELLDTMGHRAALRVFPTTDDPRVVRSAVQYELRPLENDFVQVIQVYEVYIEGNEAYWPQGGMRIYGSEGSRNLKVLPSAKRWLEEKDSAPFASLVEPIEPGEIVELSIAYVLEHDGATTVQWDAPFPVIEGMVVLEDGLALEEGAAGPGQRPPHDPEKGEVPANVMFYPLKVGEFAAGPCELAGKGDDFVCPPLLRPFSGAPISLKVSGLTTTAKWDEWVAVGLGGLLVVFVAVALIVSPRVSRRRSLEYRRDLLLHELRTFDAQPEEKRRAQASRRSELVTALDQVYRQLDVMTDARAS